MWSRAAKTAVLPYRWSNSIQAGRPPLWAVAGAFVVPSRNYSDEPKKSEEAFIKRVQQREIELQKNIPEWKKREHSLNKRYASWNPTRKLSRQQIQDLRNLKDQAPHLKTVDLANYFEVSPEAVRRILRSKWVPSDEDMADLLERAERRKTASKEARKSEVEQIQTRRDRLALSPGVNLGAIRTAKEQHDQKQAFSRRPRHHPRKDPLPARKNAQKPFVESVGDLID